MFVCTFIYIFFKDCLHACVHTFVYFMCVCVYDCVDYRRHANLCQSISVCVGGGQMQPKRVFFSSKGSHSVPLANTHSVHTLHCTVQCSDKSLKNNNKTVDSLCFETS